MNMYKKNARLLAYKNAKPRKGTHSLGSSLEFKKGKVEKGISCFQHKNGKYFSDITAEYSVNIILEKRNS